MQVYLCERLWLYFYCATAPNIERTEGQRDGRLRVAYRSLLFYERTDMSSGAQRARATNGRGCESAKHVATGLSGGEGSWLCDASLLARILRALFLFGDI